MKRWGSRLLAGVLLVNLVLVPEARAQDKPSLFNPGSYKPSSQWWAVEIKFGPYKPGIDSEFDASVCPYRQIFGKKQRLMSQLTVDLQLLKKHGTLGIGGTIGYFQAAGKALVGDVAPTACDPDNPPEKSGDSTKLNILPLVLQVVYRWDFLAKKYRVPLIPYVRAGFVYAFWWINKAGGKVAEFGQDQGKARGGTWGYQVNVGLAFNLNLLEPATAKRLDQESGVNSILLFAEFVHSSIDNFGSSKSMQLGMKAAGLFGLTVEF